MRTHPQITQIQNIGHKKAQKAQNEIESGSKVFIELNPASEIFF